MVGWIDGLHSTAICPDFCKYILFSAKRSNLKMSEDIEHLYQSVDIPQHKKAKSSETSGMSTAAIPMTQASELCVCSLMHMNRNMWTLDYKGAELKIALPGTSFRFAWLKWLWSLFWKWQGDSVVECGNESLDNLRNKPNQNNKKDTPDYFAVSARILR